jgi:hypothetical protein
VGIKESIVAIHVLLTGDARIERYKMLVSPGCASPLEEVFCWG